MIKKNLKEEEKTNLWQLKTSNWQNLKNQIVTTQTQIVTKLKNSNCDNTKKKSIATKIQNKLNKTKLKYSDCDKTKQIQNVTNF